MKSMIEFVLEVWIKVLLRKLNGTAHILMSQFISENGSPETLTMEKIVSQLETKFLQHCSALSWLGSRLASKNWRTGRN